MTTESTNITTTTNSSGHVPVGEPKNDAINTTTSSSPTAVVDIGEMTSTLFPDLTKAEEVIILAAIVVAALAVMALLLRLVMPLLRRRRRKAKKAEAQGDGSSQQGSGTSSAWSSSGSFWPDSTSEKGTATTIAYSKESLPDHPTLTRLESLNLQEVYIDNWRKTSLSYVPAVHSDMTGIKPKY